MQHVKKITSHGSVSIPASVRRELGLREKDAMDLATDGQGRIILQPHVPRCFACGGTEELAPLYGKWICGDCCWKALELLEGGAG